MSPVHGWVMYFEVGRMTLQHSVPPIFSNAPSGLYSLGRYTGVLQHAAEGLKFSMTELHYGGITGCMQASSRSVQLFSIRVYCQCPIINASSTRCQLVQLLVLAVQLTTNGIPIDLA